MRPKSVLILFVLVAALGAFIWFVERDLPGTEERARLEKRIVPIEADEITGMTIERDAGRVHLTRSGERAEERLDDDDATPAERSWQLVEPHGTRADDSKADRLADTLAGLERERVLEEADRAAVGLEPPRAVVKLAGDDSEVTLEIGADVPASSNVIVARGDQVYVVSDSIWTQVAIEPGDWRSRELFPGYREAVDRVDLTRGDAAVSLVRRDEEFWLETPLSDLAEGERVDELLDALYAARIEEFHDSPEPTLEAMGLAEPEVRLVATINGVDEPVTLELGVPSATDAERRYARLDGQLVTIGDGLDEALEAAPEEWQATSWSSLEVFQIDSFRALDAAGELLVERSGADWSRDGVRIDYQPVSDFLYALTGAAGERVVSRDAADELGADLADADLELLLQGSAAEETLRLYPVEGGAIAERDGRDYLLVLSEGTLEDLRVKLQAIRDQDALGEEPVDEEEG